MPLNKRQDDESQERQIKKLIETGTEADKKAIENRDDQGLHWRRELIELERKAGL